ncbi:Blp family class II bacteriocin [Dyadobacter crusticola]|uniref:Blp family class II bacteriocin n=1 Tax=Dyadobacter crusticola TaxID=292407 RepID=UPI0004E20E3C|nr:Blp family class II bacteriocin [Dyadobacter crusticola]
MEKLSFKTLSPEEMAKIEGGSGYCVTGGVNGAITGFCTVGSFLNPWVAGGCTAYGAWQYFAC